MIHEKRIEIRWRDVDAFRHVNNAVYATYLEECRDEWAERALGEDGDLWGFVLARVAIDYRRELTQEDDTVVVSCRLVHGIGTRHVMPPPQPRRSGRDDLREHGTLGMARGPPPRAWADTGVRWSASQRGTGA